MSGQTVDGLVIEGLRKSYGDNAVLRGIDLRFAAGEVHALLGANGAGKSTLLECLSGAVRPDEASIRVGDEHHESFTPRRAFDAGIAIIYQHFQLIGPLSVAENIFLGREIRRPSGAIDRSAQNSEAAAVMSDLGLTIDPTRAVESLSVGAQQAVEIARAVRLKPRVLILDEPTAALGRHEVASLLALVRRLADRGIAVIYVTHLLGEVLEIADRATVLRDGRVLWTRDRSDLDLPVLVEAISPEPRESETHGEAGRVVGEIVAQLRLAGAGEGGFDVSVRAGETVGVFGLLGSGRTRVLETIAGARGPADGITIDGHGVAPNSPRQAQRAGIVLVPSDRKDQSLFGAMTAAENLLMPHLSRLALSRRLPLRRRVREKDVFRTMASRVGLVPPDPDVSVESLSGGNAQKVVVARWTCGVGPARLLLLDEPTQGVDVGARRDLYEVTRQWALDNGSAVVFATSDPEEIAALADRVIVLVEGRVVHHGPADLSEAELIALAQPVLEEKRP